MFTLMLIIAVVALLAFVIYFNSALDPRQRRKHLKLANIAAGTHHGNKTYKATGAIATRFLIGKIGADDATIDTCGATDTPIGVIQDEAAAAADLVNVALLGSSGRTQLMVASGVVALGDLVVPDTGGKVKTLPVAGGTYLIIGRALKAAAADLDEIEVDPTFPIQRVVS